MRTQQFTARTVLVSLALCAGFSFFAQPAEAWPWRRAWVKQRMHQRHAETANWITVGGVVVGVSPKCYRGSFPHCKLESVYIWNPSGVPISAFGGMWYYRETPKSSKRKIGVGCRGFTGVAGLSYWWAGTLPTLNPVGLGPPFAGIKFTSPVSLGGLDCASPHSQPIVYENIQYALIDPDCDFESEPPGCEVVWSCDCDFCTCEGEEPVAVTLGCGGIADLGLPSEEEIGHKTVLVRGTIRGSYPSDDPDPNHLTVDDDAEFIIQIYEEPLVPTVSEWGMVVLALLLLTGIGIKFGRRALKTG